DYLERKPGQLSGGQRQRVAMGRAIVRAASVFLMDEPLSNRDANLRVQRRADIAGLQSRLGVTTVYVTHDQAEAMTLGNRVAVMHNGQLQQCDAPRVLYERPVNTFVAGFIGSPAMNLVTVPVANGSVSLGGVSIPAPSGTWSSLVVGVRPESLQLAAEGIPARVDVVEEIGADAFVFCSSDVGGEETKLVARSPAKSAPERGARIALRPVAEEAHIFDPSNGARIG
ncbi:MAG: ABC transporter ATP-binding protein, partial [Gaiellaceae bacterium]